MLDLMGWSGIWILNPDTEPEPQALSELLRYAEANHRNMVGSRITPRLRLDLVHNRGLAWRKWRALTLPVDLHTPAVVNPPSEDVDRRLDLPSGASLYVTRRCIERIGLMDERYFLYFEDLDWGLRAKKHGAIGYAHRSVVVHEGGTSIGTSISRRDQSPLAIYLDFRNRSYSFDLTSRFGCPGHCSLNWLRYFCSREFGPSVRSLSAYAESSRG